MPNARITEEQAQQAYETGKAVFAGKLLESQGVSALTRAGMNRASAADYLNIFRRMLLGVRYHRTLNVYSTQYFLQHILTDFGVEAAINAVKATRAHVEYYNGLGHGRLRAVERVCEDFAASLPRDDLATANFEAEVARSRTMSLISRNALIAQFPRVPQRVEVTTVAFVRNPHVAATVLNRAGGICESCRGPAPFKRASTGEPYLEIHHVVQLAHGGEDTVENAVAVCPNCHRRAHFG